MLPMVEQGNLANSFNFTLGAEGPLPTNPADGFFANATVAGTKISIFQCPSDRDLKFQITSNYAGGALSGPILTKGNYAVSWGNTNWGQQSIGTTAFLKSAFGHDGRIGFQSVGDGLSNTVFAGEVLQGAINDIRGVMWSSVPGGASFMTRFAPNQFKDYLNIVPFTGPSSGDQLNQTIFCTAELVLGLPCNTQQSAGDNGAFAAARSRHPGGINVLMGDGSVRFVKNTINQAVWIGINTIDSGEVISADAY